MEGATSGHRFLNPEGMTPARGFSHGAIPAGGKTFYIAGQTGHYEDSADLVSMTIYTTDVMGYRDSLEPVGAVYREVFGKHFLPMALAGVAELFDPDAVVELVCVAVIP